jgi:hypothetical protein
MTAPSPTTGPTSPDANARRGRALVWIAVVLGLVLVGIVAGAPDHDSGVAFDPTSTDPSGTKALVLLIESFGAQVNVSSEVPDDDVDIALLFTDQLDDGPADELDEWVARGGVLVVADPFSRFTPTADGTTGAFGVAPALEPDRCDLAALDGLGQVDPGVVFLFDMSPGDRGCYGDGDTAFVIEQTRATGSIVSVGGGQVFTNQRLGDADNAALATRLVVPSPGVRVTLLQPGDGEGGGDRSLSEVISEGARLAILQLVVAFVVYAWFRARRLGRPVLEPQPVEIAGSELVIAVGQLLQQAKSPNRAATLLRTDVRRRIAERLGAPATTPAEDLAEIVAARTGVDKDRARMVLTDTPITTDAQLLDLAQAIEALRKEVLHG